VATFMVIILPVVLRTLAHGEQLCHQAPATRSPLDKTGATGDTARASLRS